MNQKKFMITLLIGVTSFLAIAGESQYTEQNNAEQLEQAKNERQREEAFTNSLMEEPQGEPSCIPWSHC
jgi:hypothetical protein